MMMWLSGNIWVSVYNCVWGPDMLSIYDDDDDGIIGGKSLEHYNKCLSIPGLTTRLTS